MKGLFQCPPWAKSFCPFRACCLQELRQQLLNSLTPLTPEQKQLLNKNNSLTKIKMSHDCNTFYIMV